MAGSTTKISIHKDSEHEDQPSEETVVVLSVKLFADDYALSSSNYFMPRKSMVLGLFSLHNALFLHANR